VEGEALPPRGLGLGLCLAARLVEAHGGRMWASAAREGGVTIRFTLTYRPPWEVALANDDCFGPLSKADGAAPGAPPLALDTWPLLPAAPRKRELLRVRRPRIH
jgi:hypothetical protein